MYDLVIIGAGPAGITAAVYAARKKMDPLVITKDIGGQASLSGDIQNYTGYQFITGPELAIKFEEHMRKFNFEIKENEEVKELISKKGTFSVKTDKDNYQAKTVIVASGKRSRELGVSGEREFRNKGLTYCATCDGPLFAGRDVAVIGGGNSALDAVLQLTKIANKIYVINITDNLTGDGIMQEKIRADKKVFIFNNSRVKEILGDSFVQAIKIEEDKEEKVLDVQGIFVEIGLIPNSEFASDLEKNERKEIIVNQRNETNVPGIFAAGDVTNVPEKQIIIAAGEGAKAVLSTFRYLSTKK
ncbi:thioredoxin-disulfide reductase [Candidatus Atribacteria bacterium MT.SAG.1]|nr:thioredoxin-disulfide reductase [Candidatus Atribacteria bacterium MT.SAG.1]